jgi:hypothetical protein
VSSTKRPPVRAATELAVVDHGKTDVLLRPDDVAVRVALDAPELPVGKAAVADAAKAGGNISARSKLPM